jgi:alkaline phosphatase
MQPGLIVAVAILTVLVWPRHPDAAPAVRLERPTNVILMIADGCGPASVGLGRQVSGAPLALDGILVGTVATGAANSRVTDSAAGATAMASGVKTANRMIGVDPTGRRVVTVLERARERGLATGLVAKSTITDATPAAFAAHVHHRASEDSIAVQQIDLGVDLMLGGGRRWFLPVSGGGARKDSLDVIARARQRGYAYVTTPAELTAARATPLLGLFADDDMSYTLDRDPVTEPSLPEMAHKALELLASRKRGFFLMIEGSRIDHAGHSNDPAAHARELMEYDAMVRQVIDFARRDGRTLVVSTADHETGGLSLGRRIGGRNIYELRPEALRGVTASLPRMVDSIRAGVAPESVVARYTGSPLDREEQGILEAALAKDDPAAGPGAVMAALSEIVSRRALLEWGTGGHTAVDVGLYAFGPGSERFRGAHDNTDIARLLADLMGVKLSSSTPASPASVPAR